MALVTHVPRRFARRSTEAEAAIVRDRPTSVARSAVGRVRHRIVVAEVSAVLAVAIVGTGSVVLPERLAGRSSDEAPAGTAADRFEDAPRAGITSPDPPPSRSVPPASAVAVPVPAPSPPPPRVAVIGDSLIYQTAAAQGAAIEATGREATVFGDPGRSLGDPTIQAAVRAAIDDPTVGPIVLATASNDNVTVARRADAEGVDVALAEYATLLESVLAGLGDRCVVLVDVRDRSADLYRPSYAPATNEQLRRVADARPNTVVVAWSDLSRPHGDDWFVADQLHMSDATVDRVATEARDEGIRAYAGAVADGIGRCAP